MKRQARIRRVGFVSIDGHWHMTGQVTDHVRQDEFKSERQVTSRLRRVDFENGIAETENTVYIIEGNQS